MIGLSGGPRNRERARIFDPDSNLQRLSAFRQLEALDDVKPRRVWRAVIVNVSVVRKTNRVDHQRIAAFVMPDGLAVGADLGVRRMRNVEKDAAHFRSAFVDQQHLVLPLHEIKRVDTAHDEKSRDTAGAAARAGLEGALACCGEIVLLPHFFDSPRLQDGIRQIGDPERHLPPGIVVGNVGVILLIRDGPWPRFRRPQIVGDL